RCASWPRSWRRRCCAASCRSAPRSWRRSGWRRTTCWGATGRKGHSAAGVAAALRGCCRALAEQLGQPLPGDLSLRDEAAGAAAQDALIEVGSVAARGEDDRRGVLGRGQAGGHLEAVDAGHVHVEEHELRLEVACRGE